MEHIIHSVLLAFHNIALVGCAAAPFYNRALVMKRAQYGAKLHFELDKVVEDTLQGNAPYCIVFIITLFITGIGMPFNYYVFHGAFKTLHPVSYAALAVKLTFIFAMVAIMMRIFIGINPRLKALFSRFSSSEKPNETDEKSFFALRAKRKLLCEWCLRFAIVVLIASAFLGFSPSATAHAIKLGVIIETKEPEKAWNAFRFAVSSKRSGHEVKVFLMGEAVECERISHAKYNVSEQLKQFVEAGGTISACGTCLTARNLDGTEACPLSTMRDCVTMVEWADKVVTF